MGAPSVLTPEQQRAADPLASAWVAASAGTGKTQVLIARVLRLLLSGAPPETILCLTYTKAAAAEMKRRLFDTLARWATVDGAALGHELVALGAIGDAATCARARTLFARAIETRGGLAIQTLHAFAQSILASFPLEADVPPGFRTLEGGEANLELRQVASSLISKAERLSDHRLLEDLAIVGGNLTGSKDQSESFLARATTLVGQAGPLIEARLGRDALEPLIRRALGLPIAQDSASWLVDRLTEDKAFAAGLHSIARAWTQATPTQQSAAGKLTAWQRLPVTDQAEAIEALFQIFLTDGAPRKNNMLGPKALAAEPDLAARIEAATDTILELDQTLALFEVARVGAAHLRLMLALGADFERVKRQNGTMRFDDLIGRAAALFAQPGAADWVRFKLDQQVRHVLVDEAQDTNHHQWNIVRALADEYFAGLGAGDDQAPGPRTLFAVGDVKQAIFGFQGTDPATFQAARAHFLQLAEAAEARMEAVPLARSFRSTAAVLDLVDAVLADLTPSALGQADDPFEPHRPNRTGHAGRVELWPLVERRDEAPETEWTPGAADPWEPAAQAELASRIATRIRSWLDDGVLLEARGRPVQPGDILILVQQRTTLVGPLLSELAAAHIPVAGHDRLLLTGDIAVRDMMALIRFVLQPGDDLSLAELLRSPLLDWSEEQLMALAAPRPEGEPLWTALVAAAAGNAVARQAYDWLSDALGRADTAAPYEFLSDVLGPLRGRGRLAARLGAQAHDPLDALLDLALAFESLSTPSLQGFLCWLEASDREVKRDPDAPRQEVRILTVHGAKGLQAPIVILADAGKPARLEPKFLLLPIEASLDLPLWFGAARNLRGALLESLYAAAVRQSAQENNRLLYVALTRAEDWLFVAGWQPGRKGAAVSWHARVEAALDRMGAQRLTDPLWGAVLRHACLQASAPARDRPQGVPTARMTALPDWTSAAPPPESRPWRPLTPSARIDTPDVRPPQPAVRQALRRGALLHRLIERLPATPVPERDEAARRWLAHHARDLDDASREEIARAVLDILANPEHAALFGPDSLAEAPIAAVLGQTVIQGRIDRLLVTPTQVTFVDFKTAPVAPSSVERTPPSALRQMAAYRAALRALFPDRRLVAALLWTSGPVFAILPDSLLDTVQSF